MGLGVSGQVLSIWEIDSGIQGKCLGIWGWGCRFEGWGLGIAVVGPGSEGHSSGVEPQPEGGDPDHRSYHVPADIADE